MKVKTCELTGAALDYTVATIPGTPGMDGLAWAPREPGLAVATYEDGGRQIVAAFVCTGGFLKVLRWKRKLMDSGMDSGVAPMEYAPSTLWLQGGPIIERERIEFRCHDDGTVDAFWRHSADAKNKRHATGPRHLIAAMRCFVASRFGDEVDVPKELMLDSSKEPA